MYVYNTELIVLFPKYIYNGFSWSTVFAIIYSFLCHNYWNTQNVTQELLPDFCWHALHKLIKIDVYLTVNNMKKTLIFRWNLTYLPQDPNIPVNGSQNGSYTSQCLGSFLLVPQLSDLLRILPGCLWVCSQGLSSTWCLVLWHIISAVHISVSHGRQKESHCFHSSYHCILLSSPSLYYFSLDGLIGTSGLPWQCMFPMNIPTPHSLYLLKTQLV